MSESIPEYKKIQYRYTRNCASGKGKEWKELTGRQNEEHTKRMKVEWQK